MAMKKFVAAVLVLLAMAAVGAAYADEAKDSVGKDPAKKEYYFVFVPKLVHPFYEPVKKGFEAAIEEYAKDGIKITWDWDAPAAPDAILQTEKIEQVVAKGPDAIGVAVQEPAVIDKVVAEVEAAGIPVVLFADDTASGAGSAFVGIKDLVGTGEVMGDLLAEAIDYKGEVGLLLGTLTAQSHTERIQGVKKALAKYPDIKIVAEQTSDDNLEKAVQETEKMLNAYPNLSAVIGGDASGAAGAARAIVDSGKKGKVLVYGFDDIDENLAGIRDGSIVAVYAQDAFSTGYYALKAMVSVADKKITNANKVSIESDNRLLTKDTLAQYGY
jgi:ribose transport system substrate-binding protein